MQIKKVQLQRQQIIMAKLGFYRHKCDGIWGPESITAKKRWESDASFIPALPTNGLPFGDRDPLPKGVSHDRATRLFTVRGLTDEEIQSHIERAQPAQEKRREPEPESKAEPVSIESTEQAGGVASSSETIATDGSKGTQSAFSNSGAGGNSGNGFKKKRK